MNKILTILTISVDGFTFPYISTHGDDYYNDCERCDEVFKTILSLKKHLE